MHQHDAFCPRAERPSAAAGLQHLYLRDLVPGRAGTARFWPAGQRKPRMARAVSPAVTIRFATADDVPLLLQLIRALAAFEKSPGAVVATEEELRRHGFGPQPQFEAILAFLGGEPAGVAPFHSRFSTWLGRPGMYLEDLFVTEKARAQGIGRRLMTRLAAIAVERG